MLVAAVFSIELLSTIRAWVEGEGLYSKGQKNATFYLLQYALSGADEDFRRYEAAIRFPLGDYKARLALERSPPDIAAAREGLLEGGSSAADVPSIITVFRLFRNVGQVRQAIAIWTEGDSYTLQLEAIAAQLRPAHGNALTSAERARIIEELNRINHQLTPLAARFSSTLGDLARTTRTLLILALAAGTLLTSALCIRVTQARVRERDAKEERLARISELYAALSQASQLVSRVRDRDSLFGELCKVCVGTSGIELAAVGLQQSGTPHLQFVASWGKPHSAPQNLDRAAQAGSAASLASLLRTQQPWVSNDMPGPDSPFASEAAFPLRCQGTTIGVLCVFSSEPGFFQQDIVELMAQLTQEASFALDTLHHEEERYRQATLLAEQNRILNLIAAGTELQVTLDALAAFVESQSGASCALVAEKADGTTACLGRSPSLLESRIPVTSKERSSLPATRKIIGGQNQLLGTLALYTNAGDTPTSLDSQLVDVCVNLAGIAIESSRAAERIRHLAHHDELTGLPNRLLFHLQVSQALARAERTGRTVGLLFFDLDRFKVINDTLGHEAGDIVLKQIARHLRACVRRGDTLARVGGDEFALLVEQISDPNELSAIAAGLLAAMTNPLTIGGQVCQLSGSIGVAVYPKDGADGPTLLKNADIAMYRAKGGRNQFQFYSRDMDQHTVERLSLENELRQAIAQQQFEVFYQPKINFRSGEIAGAEALVRWRHPQRGLLLPGAFIQVAEEMGLIGAIGNQVLATVCRAIVKWREAGLPARRIAINLSAQQFADQQLLDHLDGVLHATQCDPNFLEFEITESTVMSDPDRALTQLEQIKTYGITIAIDDFGTGHSSLAYLKRFPVDSVKIDYAFVRDIVLDPDDIAIIKAIIALGHSLDLKVVAEGVETQRQLEILRKLGCDEYQGFLCSEAVPESRFAQMLADTPAVKTEITGAHRAKDYALRSFG